MRRKIPSLQALACFDAAARHQSYTRAAQELALTQSAVSRQVATLEAYIGQPLFRRTRHGVALTQRGADYARSIAPRLQALERDTLDAMSGHGAAQSVTLAVVPTFATRWLIPRLDDLRRLHPELVVHIETRTRPFLFADTEFDAALFAGTDEQVANWPGTRSTLLLREDLLPVCTPGLLPDSAPSPGSRQAPRGGARKLGAARRFLERRPMSVADLARQPLLQQSTRPLAWREWFHALAADAPMALAGPRYELFSMTAAAAVQGLGVALVPRLLIEEELRTGSLVVACQAHVPGARAYYLVTPERSERPAVGLFAAWVATAAQHAIANNSSKGSMAPKRAIRAE